MSQAAHLGEKEQLLARLLGINSTRANSLGGRMRMAAAPPQCALRGPVSPARAGPFPQQTVRPLLELVLPVRSSAVAHPRTPDSVHLYTYYP